jgi:hypothetical protein
MSRIYINNTVLSIPHPESMVSYCPVKKLLIANSKKALDGGYIYVS